MGPPFRDLAWGEFVHLVRRSPLDCWCDLMMNKDTKVWSGSSLPKDKRSISGVFVLLLVLSPGKAGLVQLVFVLKERLSLSSVQHIVSSVNVPLCFGAPTRPQHCMTLVRASFLLIRC
jgi:hypothetical protein